MSIFLGLHYHLWIILGIIFAGIAWYEADHFDDDIHYKYTSKNKLIKYDIHFMGCD